MESEEESKSDLHVSMGNQRNDESESFSFSGVQIITNEKSMGD